MLTKHLLDWRLYFGEPSFSEAHEKSILLRISKLQNRTTNHAGSTQSLFAFYSFFLRELVACPGDPYSYHWSALELAPRKGHTRALSRTYLERGSVHTIVYPRVHFSLLGSRYIPKYISLGYRRFYLECMLLDDFALDL